MPITINLSKELLKMIPFLEDEAMKNNIAYKKNDHSGHGSGHGFEASYTIGENNIVLTIHKKPFYVTKAMVIKEVNDYVKKLLTMNPAQA